MMPVVALVVCGAPLARRTADMVGELAAAGWEVRLVGTPAARAWFGPDDVSAQFDFRSPSEPRVTADPDVVVVCPATFNTINKIAAGMADNYATSLVCQALGLRTPVLVAPMVNDKLWGHPALSSSFDVLRGAGVAFLDVRTGGSGLTPLESGSGEEIAAGFRPAWLVAAMAEPSGH